MSTINPQAGATALAPFLGVPAAITATALPAGAGKPKGDETEEETGAAAPAAEPPKDGRRRARRARRAKKAESEDPDDERASDEDENGDDDEDRRDDDRDMAAAAALPALSARIAAVRGVQARAQTRTRIRMVAHERLRIGAILKHPKAEANLAMATRLAFHTEMSAADAHGVLDTAQAGRSTLDGRMDRVPSPQLGAGGGREAVPPTVATASAWDRSIGKQKR